MSISNQSCKPPTYLASTDFLETGCHIGSVFMLTSSIYTLFLMAKKSPDTMKSSVPYMINLHVATMICDLTWAVIVLPMFFMPVIAAHASGILTWVTRERNVILWPPFAVLGGMAACLITLFEHRHQAIVTRSWFVMKRKWTRRIIYPLFYAISINFGLVELLTIPEDQAHAKQKAFKQHPCLPPIFFDDTSAVIQRDASLFNPHMYTCCFILSVLVCFYCLHVLWHLLPRNNPSMSSGTRKMLRNFFISMCVQVTIPIVVLLLPNLYWNISISFDYYSQELNNISIILFTLHGTSSSIAVIFIYKPYRVYTKKLIFYKILKLPEPRPVTIVASVSDRSGGRTAPA
ncbi:Serpentine Receptor, class H [Caenorhabditis elegans]|uniref:Serpentine Receptor, class H n=1 Tax=Caenorhabditis elegans TaxID=6239 RepID=Q9XVZ3_CAEEL|nr:Serpentine Receptor, class H [Caenorhabditis elegans]CAA22460.2 Serpentine Receptor, class H [Caenorhabditis elegans]|eukprot:NP_496974.2 Serpentine Receptor, class H [Caenorhabditis elegans]